MKGYGGMHHFVEQSLFDFSPYIYRHTYLLYENIVPSLSFQLCVCRFTLFLLLAAIIKNRSGSGSSVKNGIS